MADTLGEEEFTATTTAIRVDQVHAVNGPTPRD
jgi:hypothetical protein